MKTHNGELVKVYKFHLINTKKMSSKLGVIRYSFLEGNAFLRGKDFSFAICLEQIFLGTTKFWGRRNVWGHCPRMPPLATGLLVKQKSRT